MCLLVSETAGKEVAGVSGGLPAVASSDGDAPAAVAAELGVGELKWRSGKLVGRSDRVEDGRRGEVSVEVEWAVAMAGGGRVGLVCAQEELGSAFYRQGRRGQAN